MFVFFVWFQTCSRQVFSSVQQDVMYVVCAGQDQFVIAMLMMIKC